MGVRVWVAGSLAVAVALLDAPAGAGAGEPTKPAVYVESVSVSLVNVDVWVTTSDGATVFGLVSQDFELSEDGKPLEISNFSAPQPPPVNPPPAVATGDDAAAAGATRRDEPLTLIVLVDNESVTAANRNAVLARLQSTIERTLASGNGRLMLVTAKPTVRVRQPLTDQLSVVSAALATIEAEIATESGYADDQMVGRFLGGLTIATSDRGGSVAGTGSAVPGSPPFQMAERPAFSEAGTALVQVRTTAEQIHGRARAAILSISRLLDSLAGVPGRKVMYYVGNGIPVNPGADMLNAWEAQFGRSETTVGLSVGLEAERLSLAPLLEEVVGRANAGRVTLSCVDTATNRRTVNTLAESRPLQSNSGIGFGTDSGRRVFLQTLAGGTGGCVLANTPDLASDVAAALNELRTAYSLAFATEHGGDGKLHKVAVKVRRGSTRVRYRSGYVDKGSDDRMVDRSLAALFVGETPNPLAASLSLGTEVKQADGSYVVPVIVNVPLRNLTLLPQGEVHVGSVSAWFAAGDDDGRISQPAKQTFTFKIANQRLLTALSQSVSYPVQFLMKPGNKRVVASLRDDNGVTDSSVVIEFTVPVGAATGAGTRE